MDISSAFENSDSAISGRDDRRERQAGFTLLELMIVLALLGLIAGTIGVAAYRRFHDGQIKTAQIQVRETMGHVEQFMIMKSKCPTAEDLVNEHYLPREPRDPWGAKLQIRCPGEHQHYAADVVSYGPDKAPDTSDDIRSWEL